MFAYNVTNNGFSEPLYPELLPKTRQVFWSNRLAGLASHSTGLWSALLCSAKDHAHGVPLLSSVSWGMSLAYQQVSHKYVCSLLPQASSHCHQCHPPPQARTPDLKLSLSLLTGMGTTKVSLLYKGTACHLLTSSFLSGLESHSEPSFIGSKLDGVLKGQCGLTISWMHSHFPDTPLSIWSHNNFPEGPQTVTDWTVLPKCPHRDFTLSVNKLTSASPDLCRWLTSIYIPFLP